MEEVQLSYQELSYYWLIAIHGPSEEIIKQYFWGFYNHGATDLSDEDLKFVRNSPQNLFTAIFKVIPERLMRAFRSMERIKLENHYDQDWGKRNEKFSQLFNKKLLLGVKLRLKNMKQIYDLNRLSVI